VAHLELSDLMFFNGLLEPSMLAWHPSFTHEYGICFRPCIEHRLPAP
jgi:hypothetical protein